MFSIVLKLFELSLLIDIVKFDSDESSNSLINSLYESAKQYKLELSYI